VFVKPVIGKQIMIRAQTSPRLKQQYAYSIVELMVSITLSLILLLGLSSLLVGNIRTSAEMERGNQQMENGRYAMEVLAEDISNAGYLAQFNPAFLATPVVKPDPCALDVDSLKVGLSIAIQAYDNNVTTLDCLSDLKAGSDVLVIRRTSMCALGEVDCDAYLAGAPYFQASACSGSTELGATNSASYYALDTSLATLTKHKKDCLTLAPQYQLRTHIYFVANNDKAGDGIVTLKRAELRAGVWVIVPIVNGIENLQLEYGIDNAIPSTGLAAFFTSDPDSYAACVAADCMKYWRNTVAVKVYVLAKNISPSNAYLDGKIYTMGRLFNNNPNEKGPFNDAYRRRLYSSEIRLNNVAGRNVP
jgi:type IV pilus assembly protein PilW